MNRLTLQACFIFLTMQIKPTYTQTHTDRTCWKGTTLTCCISDKHFHRSVCLLYLTMHHSWMSYYFWVQQEAGIKLHMKAHCIHTHCFMCCWSHLWLNESDWETIASKSDQPHLLESFYPTDLLAKWNSIFKHTLSFLLLQLSQNSSPNSDWMLWTPF